MSELEVRIVTLEPMRMASFYGYGDSPEAQAWEKAVAWGKGKGILDDPKDYRNFGFNNPDPSTGTPNYGYEIWIPVGKDVEPEGEMRIVEFYGGLYAVTRFKDLDNIGRVWKELVKWRENSKYQRGYRQCMEELLVAPDTPLEEYVFDLYLPIVE